VTFYLTPVKQVVMVFYGKERDKPQGVTPTSVPFRLVTFRFNPVNPGGIFEL
jgi:hypothetical protein